MRCAGPPGRPAGAGAGGGQGIQPAGGRRRASPAWPSTSARGLAGIGLPSPGGAVTVVRAGGAAGLPVLARRTVEAGLTGLEWAVGVPGSVGGAVRMNAGGHGADTAASLVRYRWVDLRRRPGPGRPGAAGLRLPPSSVPEPRSWCGPSSGSSRGPGDAGPGGHGRDRPVAAGAPARGAQCRLGLHQPARTTRAGRLVEAAGLKGLRRGRRPGVRQARQLHPGRPRGSADDVVALMDHVRAVVAHRFGVLLVPEVRRVGFDQLGRPESEGP